MDRFETYTNALIRFGERNQMIVAVEELSECQKEIADSMIMLEQLTMMFSLQDCVENYTEMKLKRLDERCKA